MGRVIAICNHKGGVAKTTTTSNLGAALAKRGYRVLLVDLDAQASLTISLGAGTENPGGIYEALTGKGKAQPVEVAENLEIIRASRDLSAADIELSQKIGREYKLKTAIEPLVEQYDYIIIDCAPSLGLLTINSLSAADSVVIPLQAQYLALQGLADLLEIYGQVKQLINPQLTIDAALVVQYDSRKILNKNVLESVQEYFGSDVLTETIRDNVALAEAPAQGVDIFRYAPTSAGAADYSRLADNLLKRWNGKQ